MSKRRINVYLEGDHARLLEELSITKRVAKSQLVARAITEVLLPDGGARREAALFKRLDRLSLQYATLEQGQLVAIETLVLFIRQFLSATAAIPESQQEAARAQGRARFEQFFEQLVRHLERGTGLIKRLEQARTPAVSAPLERSSS